MQLQALCVLSLAVLVWAHDEKTEVKADAGGTVNTRAGPGAEGGGQQSTRIFNPALLGSLVNTGANILSAALGGGHQHGGGHHHGGGHRHDGGFNHFGGGFNQFGGGRPFRPGGGFGHHQGGGGFGHHGGGFGGHHGGGGFGGHHGGGGFGGHHGGGFGGHHGGGGFGGHHGGGGFGGHHGGGGFGGHHGGGFGGGGFGQEKGGTCPAVRPQCPPTRIHAGPQPCFNDFGCSAADKCCFDVCLKQRVCKPPL